MNIYQLGFLHFSSIDSHFFQLHQQSLFSDLCGPWACTKLKHSSLNQLPPQKVYSTGSSGLYYKHFMILNAKSTVVRMMLQVVVSPMIVILTTLEVSFMHLENIFSTRVTHDICQKYFYSTGHRLKP